jgi:predicted Zn-dependent protease
VKRTLLVLPIILSCTVTGPDRVAGYDFRMQPGNRVFSWPIDRLPVQYFAQQIGALPTYVTAGIALWQSAFLYGEFEGHVTTDSAHADVVVLLQGGTPPGAPLTSAPPVNACDGSTTTNQADAAHLSGPIIIRIRWTPGNQPEDIANCLARVTAHEIGHSLGLLQHSTDPADLMYSVPVVSLLSQRDVSTAQTLYHTQPNVLPAPPP